MSEEQPKQTDQTDEAEEKVGEDDENGEAQKAATNEKKKKMIRVLIGVVAVLGLTGGAYFLGTLGGNKGQQVATLELGAPVDYELPEIAADLKTGRCRSPFLRTVVLLQLSDAGTKVIDKRQVRIMDAIRSHLRDQERQDLVGKTGTDKLRFDLANIVNKVIAPERVQAVLFKKFLMQ